jgi:hypothetical protein
MNVYMKNLKIKKKNFIKFQNKQLHDKPNIKSFFSQNLLGREPKYINPINVGINYYTIDKPLPFVDGKYTLMKSNANNIVLMITYGVITPFSSYLGYKSIASIIKLKILGSLSWSIIFLISVKMISHVRANISLIIIGIDILEDGEHVEIITSRDKFVVDIANIRRCTSEEALEIHASIIRGNDYHPIFINDQTFLFPSNCEITDKSMLNAISVGSYIRVESKDKNEKIIDI